MRDVETFTFIIAATVLPQSTPLPAATSTQGAWISVWHWTRSGNNVAGWGRHMLPAIFVAYERQIEIVEKPKVVRRVW